MTDKIDLLPMPEGEAFGVIQAWSRNQMRDYARANVLHHTATLQAEIEALRAEVAEWKGIAVAQAAEIERLRA